MLIDSVGLWIRYLWVGMTLGQSTVIIPKFRGGNAERQKSLKLFFFKLFDSKAKVVYTIYPKFSLLDYWRGRRKGFPFFNLDNRLFLCLNLVCRLDRDHKWDFDDFDFLDQLHPLTAPTTNKVFFGRFFFFWVFWVFSSHNPHPLQIELGTWN